MSHYHSFHVFVCLNSSKVVPLAIWRIPSTLATIIYNLHFVCDNYLVTSLDGHDKKVSVNAQWKN